MDKDEMIVQRNNKKKEIFLKQKQAIENKITLIENSTKDSEAKILAKQLNKIQ